MRNYKAISTIRAQGCRGNNKSADCSSVWIVDLRMKGKDGKMKGKIIKRKELVKERLQDVLILTSSTGRCLEQGFH